MTRFLTVGGVVLAFSLGCANLTGGDDEPQPASAIDQEVPGPAETPEVPTASPGDAADMLPEEGGEDVTCCCAYTEDGSDGLLHAEMLQTNCTSWGFECADAAKCEQEVDVDADEGEVDAEPEPAPAPSGSTMTRSSGGSTMSRPDGSSSSGSTMTRPGSDDDKSSGTKMTRPK